MVENREVIQLSLGGEFEGVERVVQLGLDWILEAQAEDTHQVPANLLPKRVLPSDEQHETPGEAVVGPKGGYGIEHETRYRDSNDYLSTWRQYKP